MMALLNQTEQAAVGSRRGEAAEGVELVLAGSEAIGGDGLLRSSTPVRGTPMAGVDGSSGGLKPASMAGPVIVEQRKFEGPEKGMKEERRRGRGRGAC